MNSLNATFYLSTAPAHWLGRFSWEWAWIALCCIFFILVAIIDIRRKQVLNIMVYPGMAAAIIRILVTPLLNPAAYFAGGLFGFGLFLLAAILRPGELGGGDVKLAALIGLVVGFPGVIWALGLGILAGGLVSAILILILKNKKTIIPYAPFLSAGAIVALFYNPLLPLFITFIGGN